MNLKNKINEKLYLLFVPLVFTLFMSCNSRDNNDSSDQKENDDQ